jgi:hypothetical protein
MTANQLKLAQKAYKRAKKDGMTTRDVISIFKTYKPKNAGEIIRIGFKLDTLGSGLFRNGHKIDKLPLVVKIPKTYSGAVTHSRNEIKMAKKLRGTKYRAIHRYIPKILYSDAKSGIIIMPKYESLEYPESSTISRFLGHLVHDLGFGGDGDIHNANVRYYLNDYDDKEYVIIDLGYVGVT